jgi:glycerol-3-phosphate dehydrogenase (NAD+)
MAKRVCIIGSGNWGSAISRIVGANTSLHKDKFETEVRMWVFEEIVNGSKLSEIINTQHENVKYLPGRRLPDNVVAVTDIVETVNDADIIIVVIPHQFMSRALAPLKGRVKAGAIGISLVKGFEIVEGGGIRLISQTISELLGGLPMAVLMGANLAHEVADGNFCETTIGCADVDGMGQELRTLFQTPNFRVAVVSDASTVEMCGALKNIVACGAGFVDGKCCKEEKYSMLLIKCSTSLATVACNSVSL